MANMKSIRLDFPAAGLSLSNSEILTVMQDAFLHMATHAKSEGRRGAAFALSRATADAEVHEYDDRYGGPVFYIP